MFCRRVSWLFIIAVRHERGRDTLPRDPRQDGPMVNRWCSASDRRRVQARPGPHMRVNIREAVQIFSLKGDQLSAQGFNPGLGNSRRCALKGHHNPARHIGSKSFSPVSSFWRHFQGAFLRGGYPGLKPWARTLLPLRGADLVPFPCVDAHGRRRTKRRAPCARKLLNRGLRVCLRACFKNK